MSQYRPLKDDKGQAAAQAVATREHRLIRRMSHDSFESIILRTRLVDTSMQGPMSTHFQTRCHCTWPAVGDSNNSHCRPVWRCASERSYIGPAFISIITGQSIQASMRL